MHVCSHTRVVYNNRRSHHTYTHEGTLVEIIESYYAINVVNVVTEYKASERKREE